eukprot:TRINITY_DN43628_c0_g1_i1.p1 TRINITY_DN43628_c0_g1~~TRINITY_DN43628_c0_g1_i1.p1  ORF type:complete len:441 (+),score=68.06 TRINITY_DN43628_c0_g1_i1:76-1323(+)
MREGWQFGVLASLLGSLSGTLGSQLRICSLAQEVKRRAQLLQVAGWAFWLLGQVLNQVAILLAPATVAACVTFSGSLLSNALLAPLVLHEKLNGMHWISVVLLAVGGGMVTSASSHKEQEFSWHQLQSFLFKPLFLSLAACFGTIAALLAVQAICRRYLNLFRFAYLFALIGAADLLVTKFTLQLLRLLVVGKDKQTVQVPAGVVPLSFGLMIMLHLAVFCCQVASAYYRKALQSLPLFLGSGALMQVLLCGIFFDEFDDFGHLQAIAFLVGFAFVLAGMLTTSIAAQSTEIASESSESLSTNPPVFRPPTAVQKPEEAKSGSTRAIISSGLLERSSSSLSSADLFLLGDIQKSALCFGGHYALGKVSDSKIGLQRKFVSENLLRPLQASFVQDGDSMLGRVASAPPMAGPLATV